MAVTPLHTTTAADWNAAKAYLDERVSAAAYTLTELTALHDSDLHEIILDPETRTVWWAYDNAPLDGEGWTIDQLAPKDAAEMADGSIDVLQDRMDKPESYLYGGDIESDQDALDEYAAIIALDLPTEPAQARSHIRGQRALIARQDALWQRIDATLVRELAGTGGKTAAARALGISDVQVGRIIRADDQRRKDLAAAVREARQQD